VHGRTLRAFAGARRRCYVPPVAKSVFSASSIHGFIARGDGSIDWLYSVQRAGEDYSFQTFHDDVDALVLGRSTYDPGVGSLR
jgi:hypothetical protein